MTGWVVRQFRGIAPRAEPRLLADNQAQTAIDCKLWHGSLRPLKGNSSIIASLPKSGTVRSIYRFGKSTDSDILYWFHWTYDTDVVRGFVAGDTYERTYWTGGGTEPRVTTFQLGTSGGSNYPVASWTLGLPRGVAPTVAIGGTGSGTAETRTYVYCWKTSLGELGPPSAASALISVLPGQTVTVSDIPAVPPTGNYDIAGKAIFRATAGTYLYVADIGAAATSYVDSVLTADLGEELQSLYWDMPPATLAGLVALPNGIMAGFKGKDVYFCEPFYPHAWPQNYILTVDDDIVALGVADATLIVLTKSAPYTVTGSHPDSMVMVKGQLPQSCVSKRSVVSGMGGVIFASPDGMFLISSAGVSNLTQTMFTRDEWQTFKPSSIHGYLLDGRYIGFYDTGTVSAGFILDPAGEMTALSFPAHAGYYDPQRDALFLAVGIDNQLVEFDAASTNLTATWHSKAFYLPTPRNIGWARVEAAGYPVTFKAVSTVSSAAEATAIAAAYPALLTASGAKLTYTATVADDRVFPLPNDFAGKVWEFEVQSSFEVLSVGIAQSPQELASG